MRHRTSRAAGFTLIEITVVVAVLAILATAITPMILQQIVDTKVETTRREAKLLYEAIVGRADIPGSFGFFGDLGRNPSTFQELLKPATGTPYYTTETFRNIGMGWKGPYINAGDTKDDVLLDAFGREYQGANMAQVRSAGPNGVFYDDDDIVYPPNPPVPYSRVLVTVKRLEVGGGYTMDPVGYTIRVFFSRNGVETYMDDPAAPFVFDRVPQGTHAIAVLRGNLVVGQDTIQVFGNGTTKLVEFTFRP
jgi:prepilin-type N-terminal cleavage/methylation domain-containing protein